MAEFKDTSTTLKLPEFSGDEIITSEVINNHGRQISTLLASGTLIESSIGTFENGQEVPYVGVRSANPTTFPETRRSVVGIAGGSTGLDLWLTFRLEDQTVGGQTYSAVIIVTGYNGTFAQELVFIASASLNDQYLPAGGRRYQEGIERVDNFKVDIDQTFVANVPLRFRREIEVYIGYIDPNGNKFSGSISNYVTQDYFGVQELMVFQTFE